MKRGRSKGFWMRLWGAVAAAALVAAAACNETGCLDNRSSIPYAGFYSYQTGAKIVLDSVEIGGVGAPHDSLLMKASDRYSNLYLPFRFEHDNTAFFIRYVSEALNYASLVDTLSFVYTSEPVFVSADCGAMYRYKVVNMSYTRHLIDSVALLDSLITNVDTERLQIFFRTSTPGADDDDDEEEEEGPGNENDDDPGEPDTDAEMRKGGGAQ